jgi:molecular chaperone GrpE
MSATNDNTAENQEPEEASPEAAPPETPQPPSAEEEVAKLKDQLLRAMAETENLRRRFEREKEEIGKYAITGFARDLVMVIENLKLAEDNIPEEVRKAEGPLKTLWEGVDMTQRELVNILQRHGIKRITPKGEKFDHNFHQAVAQVEAKDVEPGTVVDVFQAGYIIFDRLLKPAMVTVAKAPGAAEARTDTQA